MADLSTLRGAGLGAFFRARDIEALGIAHRRLADWASAGIIMNFGNGLYRFSDDEVEPTELETIAMVSAAVPGAIICLYTALRIHEIGTQSPSEVWLALGHKARQPTHPPSRIRIIRFSGAMATYGVEQRSALGVPFRITSPARTVVDCFRYRKKHGTLDVALEALYEAIRDRVVGVDEIERAAEVCRMRTIISPYIDAFGWVDALR